MNLPMRWRQALALAANACRETMRQPLVLLLTASAIAAAGLLPASAVFAFGEEARLVRDGVLALQFLAGLLAASAAASAAIFHEVRRGTAAAVLSKPVPRGLFFLASFLGILGALLLFHAALIAAALLSVRMVWRGLDLDWRVMTVFAAALVAAFAYAAAMNFWFRRPFVARAYGALAPCLAAAVLVTAALDAGQPMAEHCAACAAMHARGAHGAVARWGGLMDWGLVPAGVLVALAVTVLAALAVSLSTRLPPLLSGAAAGALFLLGLVSETLFRSAAATSVAAGALYRLLPNWQLFWMADTLSAGAAIPWSYVGLAAAYAATYAGAALAVGWAAFENADIV